jgi:hypothetical protein
METDNQVKLRLRFYKDVNENIDVIRTKFEESKFIQPEDYSIKVNENHIWFNIVGNNKHYYSPHLHLELEEKSEKETHIRALFGPDPTLWTLFMFLHFVVAGIFIIFGMFAYSNLTLKEPITLDIVVMVLMIAVWVLLYVVARQIRHSGIPQMNELELLFEKILS